MCDDNALFGRIVYPAVTSKESEMRNGMKNWTSQRIVVSMSCTLGLVLAMGAPALALTYSTQYEMGLDPSTPAGVLDASGADVNGNGVLSVGAAGTGSTFSSGIMHFVD